MPAIDETKKIMEIVYYLVIMGIAIYTLVIRKDQLFKSSLHKMQVDELVDIRKKLHYIWFNIGQVKCWADIYKANNSSLEDFEKTQPTQWEQYKKYKEYSIELFSKTNFKDYFLYPRWINTSIIEDFFKERIFKFQPFTLMSLMNKTQEEILDYQNSLLKLISYLDKRLRAKS